MTLSWTNEYEKPCSTMRGREEDCALELIVR